MHYAVKVGLTFTLMFLALLRPVLSEGSTISLVPNRAAPQLVGEQITWTASVTNGPATPVYQFRVSAGAGTAHVLRDFSLNNAFKWTPMREGAYHILVTVKAGFLATTSESACAYDVVNTRVTGHDAVVTPTLNPLVALYSAPPCESDAIHVEFSLASGEPFWHSTNTLLCRPGKSSNFLVAGMLPHTIYQMRHVLDDGTASSPILFTTDSLPATVTSASFTVRQQGPQTDFSQDIVFHVLAGRLNGIPNPQATDLNGSVIWYYDYQGSGLTLPQPGSCALAPGGRLYLQGTDRYVSISNPKARNVLRKVDLAGNPLRETSIDALNAQLTAAGHQVIYSFTHDAQLLPNGATAVLGLTERTVNINGVPTNYIGNMIVVLDRDFQVAWAWDAFDHLDVNRGPVLGEVQSPGSRSPRLPCPCCRRSTGCTPTPSAGHLRTETSSFLCATRTGCSRSITATARETAIFCGNLAKTVISP